MCFQQPCPAGGPWALLTVLCPGHRPAGPRSLNVDMEWLYGASENSNMEVDIGYIPQVSAPLALPGEGGQLLPPRGSG